MKMKLFHLWVMQTSNYDYYAGFVVAAENHFQARKLASEETQPDTDKLNWFQPKHTRCKMISTTSIYTEPTVVIGDWVGD